MWGGGGVVHGFLRNGSQMFGCGFGVCYISPVSKVPDNQNCVIHQRRVTPDDKRRKCQGTNEPNRRGAGRNLFLRISRTDPRSRRRRQYFPHQSKDCCIFSLLGCQGEQGVRNDSVNAETQHKPLKHVLVRNQRVHRR